MEIESLTNRFIPEDAKKAAQIKAESIMIFLKDAGYNNIVLSLGIEHPDRVVESEEILFLFCSEMTMRRLDLAIDHLIAHRIKTYGEQRDERE